MGRTGHAAVCGTSTGRESLFYDGAVNLADDRNADLLIDNGTTVGTVDVGDFLMAVIKIDTIEREGGGSTSINDPGSGFREMTAISLIKVATVTPVALGYASFTFVPPTIAEWTAVTTAAGFTVTPSAPGVMVSIYQGATDAHDYDRLSTIAAGLSTSSGTLMWEAGFTGVVTDPGTRLDSTDDTVAPAAFEGWDAFATIVFPPTFPPALPAGIQFGLNTISIGPAGILLDKTTQYAGVVNYGGKTDFQGTGSFEVAATGSSWPVFSNTNTYITPVIPEPTTIIIWSLLAAFGVARYGRRR